jgi:hypothetical protein
MPKSPEFSLVGHIAFLRQAASELRSIAEHEPQIASTLREFAGKIEAEADELTDAAGFKGVGFV